MRHVFAAMRKLRVILARDDGILRAPVLDVERATRAGESRALNARNASFTDIDRREYFRSRSLRSASRGGCIAEKGIVEQSRVVYAP